MIASFCFLKGKRSDGFSFLGRLTAFKNIEGEFYFLLQQRFFLEN